MISIDTNILFPLVVEDHPQHTQAAAFAESLGARSDVAISELILLELYNLLRNSAVMAQPLSASVISAPRSGAFTRRCWISTRPV